MNKKMLVIITGACMFAIGFFGLLSSPATAQMTQYCDDPNDPVGLNCVQGSGLSREDPRIIITRIINAALGLLGIIATVLILYAGFLWMTAGGNEDKITKARGILFAAVIGLIIILSAYAIASYVLDNLIVATGVRQGVPLY